MMLGWEWEGKAMKEGCLIWNTDLYKRSYYLEKVSHAHYFYNGNYRKQCDKQVWQSMG